jgi:hypothetical protein
MKHNLYLLYNSSDRQSCKTTIQEAHEGDIPPSLSSEEINVPFSPGGWTPMRMAKAAVCLMAAEIHCLRMSSCH